MDHKNTLCLNFLYPLLKMAWLLWYELWYDHQPMDSYPVQYLGYCTVCNSTNLNRWKHPMAPVKCQLINPRECEKIPNKPHLIISKKNLSDKLKKKNPLTSPVLLPLLSLPLPPSVSASYPNHIHMPTFISNLTFFFF